MDELPLQNINSNHNDTQTSHTPHHNNQQQQQQPHHLIIKPSKSDDLAQSSISLLLSHSSTPLDYRELLPTFTEPLKNKFENRSLWLRLGLTYSLSKESPSSALQAYNECMRLDEADPLPSMLAAKLMLEDFDDPDNGLNLSEEAVKRCKQQLNTDTTVKRKSFYTNLLSRSYLLASIMHAYMYETAPESIKLFKNDNLQSSLNFLDEAIATNPNDHLLYFHKALHDSRHQKAYQKAIDNLGRAIQLNPHHVPSMQLLILSLSALRHYDKALVLCESTLHEHENNLLLLYIKCNLEQCLVETKGYKSALLTAQLMLKCIRRGTTITKTGINRESSTKLSTTSQSTQALSLAVQQTNQQQQSNQQNSNQISQHHTITNISSLANNSSITLPIPNFSPPLKSLSPTSATAPAPANISKHINNLFAHDTDDDKSIKRRDFLTGELSVWLLVAEIFVKIGSIDDAEQCVDEGSIHAGGALSHQVMYVRGLISKARNNLMEAKTFFQSSLALCPRHAKASQQIAHVYYLLGNYSTAEKFLKDSLDVDGDCHKTWHYLSLVYIELSQHDKAKECAKKATQLEESSPVVPISAISRLTFQ